MKSLIYTLVAPHTLALVENDIEWPPIHGDGILCETIISGISPGTELAAWNGENPLRPSGGYPRKIGYQNIAKVIDISGGDGRIQKGDRVYTNQSHCSKFSCKEEEVLAIIPKDKHVKDYIFSYMYHMALCALSINCNQKTISREQRIAVFGGGALGCSIVEVAKLLGYSVLQISDSKHLAKLQPSTNQIISRKEFKMQFGKASEFNNCIVTTNRWDDYDSSLSTCLSNGTIVLVGFPGRDGSLPSTNPFEPKHFYLNKLKICSLPGERRDPFASHEVDLSIFESMNDIVLKISQGLFGQTFSESRIVEYEDLEKAYRALSSNRNNQVSLSVNWS